MSSGIRSVFVTVLIAGLMWGCGGERVTQSQRTEADDQVGQPLSKLAAQQKAPHAVVVTLSQDGEPVSGAAVEFARSIAGQAADYAEFAVTLIFNR